MFSRDYDARYSGGAGAGRDAVDGFSAIAAALDRGVGPVEARGSNVADMLAIGLGWIVLATVIYYPALQLAAICACVAFMGLRAVANFLFGQVIRACTGIFPMNGRADRTMATS